MLHFIRHGETDYNVARRLAGGDVEARLTPGGEEMARRFARENAEFLSGLEALVVSPQIRTQKTAELVLPHCSSRIHIETEEGLREWILGSWSGRPYSDNIELFAEPPPDPDGGEPFGVFESRVLSALSRIARRPEQKILVVAHGGVWFAYAHWQDPFLSKTTGCIDNNTLEQMEREALRHAFDYSLACG